MTRHDKRYNEIAADSNHPFTVRFPSLTYGQPYSSYYPCLFSISSRYSVYLDIAGNWPPDLYARLDFMDFDWVMFSDVYPECPALK
jgi:hypothetical protein